MKKIGFTLAEVLITLAIIGFIASITLPSITGSTRDRQAIVALKKGVNTLTTAANMSNALNGTDYSTIISMNDLRTILANTANVQNTTTDDVPSTMSTTDPTGRQATNNAIFFRDGSALIYDATHTITTAERATSPTDNLPNGIAVIYDTNGLKAPNRVSYCSTESCATRLIYDQFPLKLRGTVVVPNGNASRWALAQ